MELDSGTRRAHEPPVRRALAIALASLTACTGPIAGSEIDSNPRDDPHRRQAIVPTWFTWSSWVVGYRFVQIRDTAKGPERVVREWVSRYAVDEIDGANVVVATLPGYDASPVPGAPETIEFAFDPRGTALRCHATTARSAGAVGAPCIDASEDPWADPQALLWPLFPLHDISSAQVVQQLTPLPDGVAISLLLPDDTRASIEWRNGRPWWTSLQLDKRDGAVREAKLLSWRAARGEWVFAPLAGMADPFFRLEARLAARKLPVPLTFAPTEVRPNWRVGDTWTVAYRHASGQENSGHQQWRTRYRVDDIDASGTVSVTLVDDLPPRTPRTLNFGPGGAVRRCAASGDEPARRGVTPCESADEPQQDVDLIAWPAFPLASDQHATLVAPQLKQSVTSAAAGFLVVIEAEGQGRDRWGAELTWEAGRPWWTRARIRWDHGPSVTAEVVEWDGVPRNEGA